MGRTTNAKVATAQKRVFPARNELWQRRRSDVRVRFEDCSQMGAAKDSIISVLKQAFGQIIYILPLIDKIDQTFLSQIPEVLQTLTWLALLKSGAPLPISLFQNLSSEEITQRIV